MYLYDKSVDLRVNGYLRIKYLYQNCGKTVFPPTHSLIYAIS